LGPEGGQKVKISNEKGKTRRTEQSQIIEQKKRVTDSTRERNGGTPVSQNGGVMVRLEKQRLHGKKGLSPVSGSSAKLERGNLGQTGGWSWRKDGAGPGKRR